MPIVFDTPAALLDAIGTDLGATEWMEITQERIHQFAEATGDHQWIHVDPEKAANGPFGSTIAHGYLTLALTNLFLPQLVEVHGISMGVNYGVNKVRFPAAVPVGARVRGSAALSDATAIEGGVQTVITVTVEIEGGTKPACVVESISRWIAG